ncbi:hypothetical protein IAD21_01790 [Abditibacteriota bacterium]|nr:hypothetical protein IAD21_01790 [Abditibacteriota bacterium]
MTQHLRQVKTFQSNTNEGLADEINKWINSTHNIPLSMTVSSINGAFYGFVIYDAPPEKQRHLGMR